MPRRFDSPAAMTRFLLAHSPAHRAAVDAVGPAAPEMLAAVEDLAAPAGRPVRIEAEYLLVTATG